MRITIVNLLYPPIQVGGAEKAVAVLAEALASREHQVTVISLHPGSELDVEIRGRVRVYRLPLDNLYWPFNPGRRQNAVARFWWQIGDIWNEEAARRVGQILDEVKPDVVHTNIVSGFSVSVWKEVKKRNIRLVHTLHDYYLLCFHPGMFRYGRSCQRQCLDCVVMTNVKKRWSHQVDAVVSVSGAVLEIHRKLGYFRGVPGSVIYNIQEIASESNLDSRRGSGEPHMVVFGFIGALVERKGIGNLLKATARLSSRHWRLVIAGTGAEDYVEELKREYLDDRIEWLGFVTPADFYPMVDVVIVPSIWQDPLPYVVIESFAFGKAVICAESGGLPELALLGKCVKTYPSADVLGLAEEMEKVLSGELERPTGGFADENARNAFSEDVVAESYCSVYRQTR